MSSGGDTINQRLLEGARRHNRSAVFAHREGGEWIETPDWRADRHAIRAALALREGIGVGAGDVVAIAIPFGVEWPILERGVWMLGAVSLPIFSDWSSAVVHDTLSRAKAAVTFETPKCVRELLDRGGVLDTPERATRLRAAAREVEPSAIASLEPSLGVNGVELEPRTQADWSSAVERFLVRHPGSGVRSLISERPDRATRLVLYAGWSDGRTRTVLGGREGVVFEWESETSGTLEEGFVNLSEL